jgi:hypothetical protein
VRTKILKSNERLYADVHKVLEYYCYSKNVIYCQGMIEVLMPFLFMKQHNSSSSSSNHSSVYSTELENQFDLACVYSHFKRFVSLYIPNTLHTKFNGRGGTSLPYLKCALILTEILL